jgi:hypothetical protein
MIEQLPCVASSSFFSFTRTGARKDGRDEEDGERAWSDPPTAHNSISALSPHKRRGNTKRATASSSDAARLPHSLGGLADLAWALRRRLSSASRCVDGRGRDLVFFTREFARPPFAVVAHSAGQTGRTRAPPIRLGWGTCPAPTAARCSVSDASLVSKRREFARNSRAGAAVSSPPRPCHAAVPRPAPPSPRPSTTATGMGDGQGRAWARIGGGAIGPTSPNCVPHQPLALLRGRRAARARAQHGRCPTAARPSTNWPAVPLMLLSHPHAPHPHSPRQRRRAWWPRPDV